ncbi:MAG: hypothetical protein ACTSRW_16750 [Candidatus Helarchaeota archaeon]
MAIDSTSKEYNFQRSIKKLFLAFSTTFSTAVFFEEQDDVPKDSSGDDYSKWLVVIMGKRDRGTVNEQMVNLSLFTNNDTEADDLIKLSDDITSLFYDSETGIIPIDLYNTDPETWIIVGGIIPYPQPFSEIYHSKDNTKYRICDVLCKWGGK